MSVILAIESSCDDTSAAICKDGKILANVTASQAIHEEWGGVVPELASREHLKNIVVVVDAAIKKSGVSKKDLSAIAFTRGPGLIGSLMVGVSFAKSMALALDIPLIEVHHMQAHIMANFIDQQPDFPHLCLTVSGGHTQLILVKAVNDMHIVGETIDDAAGEAFDKIAKILGLPYPGGPILDKMAQTGNPDCFQFPDSKVDNFDFSFSGLKTSVLYFIQKGVKEDADFVAKNLADICASVQKRIVDTLIKKFEKAALFYNVSSLALAGGVSANSSVRKAVLGLGEKHQWRVFIPKLEYCTDNAGMIAITAYYKYLENDFCGQDVEPVARISF
jgi:N6-L-threonylcarbamoyladenine synthase